MSLIGCWIEGRAVTTLPNELRATHYGDGVFRTMPRTSGTTSLLAQQLARLSADAGAIGIDVSAAMLSDALDDTPLPDEAVIKLCAWRGGAGRGYAPAIGARPLIAVYAYALPTYPAAHWRDGIAVATLSFRLGAQPATAGIKHCNRLDQVLAARELADRADAVEGLCRDPRGNVVCGTRSNLFWSDGSTLCTPTIADCGVRGVMRERVLALAAERGIATAERACSTADLAAAREIMVTNSVVGLWPVCSIDDRRLPDHAMAHCLQAALGHPLPQGGHACGR